MASFNVESVGTSLESRITAQESTLTEKMNSVDVNNPLELSKVQMAMTKYQTAIGLESALVKDLHDMMQQVLNRT